MKKKTILLIGLCSFLILILGFSVVNAENLDDLQNRKDELQ